MKIGIFTFHCAHNFGAVLQAYALQTYLRNLGHESYVVDYRPDFLVRVYKKFSIYNWISKNPKIALKKFLIEFFLAKKRVSKWNQFNYFISHSLKLYPYPLSNNGKEFDLVLFGSDQIWNSKITGGKWDGAYFGLGLKTTCCSYAASMGWDTVDRLRKKEFLSLLSQLTAISVREDKLRDELQCLTDNPIYLVCDPVFLLSTDEWKRIIHPVSQKKPYVLCFNLLHTNECDEQAKIVSKTLGCELIEITGDVHYVKGYHKVLQDISPIDFISYIASAAFVVTSSFHATAFSVIFQKSFYSVGMGEKNGRVASLLGVVGLQDRLLLRTTNQITKLNYSELVKVSLEKYINMSKTYLENQCLNNE